MDVNVSFSGVGKGYEETNCGNTMNENGSGDGSHISGTMGHQTINLTGTDSENSFAISGDNVDIVVSGNSGTGSNKVKAVPVVTYDWEMKWYSGNLVAIHQSENYIAYILKKTTGTGGLVRIISRPTSERLLLKGFIGKVCDIAFAHLDELILLACVDEPGNLYVYEIQEADATIKSNCILKVNASAEIITEKHRVIWCPYIPDDLSSDDASDDVGQLLVLTHDTVVEMWSVDMVRKQYGEMEMEMELERHQVEIGVLVIDEHDETVTAASFSPDGTALATASANGEVKFFQVYMHEHGSTPRCLHKWSPHNGKPLSSLFFLDNHKNPSLDVQFWKYAVTGASSNTEIKVWSCETWTCLQTIRFLPPLGGLSPQLQAFMDLSATYLLMSDISRKVLYILQLRQGQGARIGCINEFLLAQPLLSLAVLRANRRRFKKSIENGNLDEITSGTEETGGNQSPTHSTDRDEEAYRDGVTNVIGVAAKIYAVFPKALQELHIQFEPDWSCLNIADNSVASVSLDESMFKDGLSDISMSVEAQADGTMSSKLDVLLTPEAFTNNASPGKLRESGSMYMNSSLGAGSPRSSHEQTPVRDTGPSMEYEKLPSGDDFGTSSPAASKIREGIISSARSVRENFDNANSREDRSSASSSTSLEVSEIMDLASTNSTYKKTLAVQEEDATVVEQGEDEGDDAVVEEEEENVTRTPTASGSSLQPVYSSKAWPQPPNIAELDSSANSIMALKRQSLEDGRSAENSVDGISNVQQDSTMKKQSLSEGDMLMHSSPRLAGRLPQDEIMRQLQEIQTLLKVQQLELQELRQESSLNKLSNSVTMPAIKTQMDAVTSTLKAHYDQAASQKTHADTQRFQSFEQFLKRETTSQKERDERLSAGLNQSVNAVMTTKLEKLVKTEMKNTVLPGVKQTLEPLKADLQNEVSLKLTSADAALKDGIGKLVRSRGTTDAISQAIANVIQPIVQKAYVDSYQSMVLPAFERACQAMFGQINETFQKGTREYLNQLQFCQQKQQQTLQDMKDPALKKLQEQVDAFQKSSEHLSSTIISDMHSNLKTQLQTTTNRMQDMLCNNISAVIKDEMKLVLKEQQTAIGDSVVSALRSNAATPVPKLSMDLQTQKMHLQQLLQQKQLNEAFQTALSASNLSLVMFVCNAIQPADVFEKTPCPLQQPVLLSLISQLSADLTTETELKHKYIEEAVMNLDAMSPLVKEHIPTVIGSLRKKLMLYLEAHADGPMARNMKMLLMAAKSLLGH